MRSTWVGTYVPKMPNPEYARSEYAVRQIDCTKPYSNCSDRDNYPFMDSSAQFNDQASARLNGASYTLYRADCLERMELRGANSVHAIVTDLLRA
jgi:hypothetical protein